MKAVYGLALLVAMGLCISEVSAGTKEMTCSATNQTASYRLGEKGYDTLVNQINVFAVSARDTMPDVTQYRQVPRNAQLVAYSYQQEAQCKNSAVAQSGNVVAFDEPGDKVPFPGTDAPNGSTMTVITCVSGIRRTTTYRRVNGTWVVISYKSEFTTSCALPPLP